MKAPVTDAGKILATAAARGLQKALPYAGEVTPQEAYSLYSTVGARIVDVRSRFECEYIGRVPGSSLIEWKHWPSGVLNANFLPELRRQCRSDEVVLFLCRSGVRSHATAAVAAEAGYLQAYNILEGFEGDLDRQQQRGRIGGWRLAGLPWCQS